MDAEIPSTRPPPISDYADDNIGHSLSLSDDSSKQNQDQAFETPKMAGSAYPKSFKYDHKVDTKNTIHCHPRRGKDNRFLCVCGKYFDDPDTFKVHLDALQPHEWKGDHKQSLWPK